jgi:pimeloyl-ACP methyl ester carboxylesterase/DNA-binding CsgD family transcriptional regulator
LIYEAEGDPQAWRQLLPAIGELIAPERCNEELIWACLAPHFSRSQSIQRDLRETETERDLLESVMERMPFGVAIVDNQARAISLNSAMLRLIQSSPHLILQAGYLQTDPPHALTEAVRHVLDGQRDGVFLRLSTPVHTHSAAITLWVGALGGSKESDRAMVLASDPTQRVLPAQDLVAFFGLSPAQARLAQQIAQGQSLEEAAVTLGISHNTAKAQLKKVFAKVGIQRQSQLIKAIYDTPLWLNLAAQTSNGSQTQSILRSRPVLTDGLPKGESMVLPDGRTLAWSDSGHPQGHPVVLCHAFLHGQHDRHPDDALLYRLGIRLLIPERPGCGHSDPHEGATIEDWPLDIEQLLVHLDVGRFSVIGWSMGTPYALALVHHFGARVVALHLASPIIPIISTVDLRHYSSQSRLFLMVGLYTPRLLPLVATAVVKNIQRDVFSFQDHFYAKAPAAEKAIFESALYRQQRAQVLLQAASGGATRIAEQALLAFFQWKPQVLSAAVPCKIWHGQADPEVHRDAARSLAQALGDVPMHVIAGAGHHVLISHWHAIFKALSLAHANHEVHASSH